MLNLTPLPYRILIGALLLAGLFGYGFYEGKITQSNVGKVALDIAIQQKLVAEQKASQITIQTVEKVVYRDKIIQVQGAKVTEYIDRWHEAIDQTCTLSKEAVSSLNQAAQEPK